MALNTDLSPIQKLVERAAASAGPAEWIWPVGIAVLAIVLARYLARATFSRMQASPRWKMGKGDFAPVAFPLFALVLVSVGKLVLARYQPVELLAVIQPLLLAWLVIRLAVYILGHVLPEGVFLRNAVRVVAWIVWIGVVLHVTGLLPDTIAALDEVGFTAGKNQQRITLWLAMQAVAALAVTLTLTMWLGRITETRVLAAETVQMSTRIVVAKLVRAGALLVAILVALPMVGIDITALSVFGGALGVGLGFGLQKIASNYVSGFIVLLDRSLRIGDVVTVDGRRGEVKAIESRYTVIKALDGTEALIPNETMISQTVIQHTFTDPKVLVGVPLSVAYDTDVDRACTLLLEVALRNPRVLAEPAPAACVTEFADSGINMRLLVWIADPGAGELGLRSDLLRDILRTFRDHGIEIPYPRREVTILSTPETREKDAASRA